MTRLSSNISKAVQKGFTLIELVIVIVIVGILAAVALPNFTNTTESATKATNTAVLGMVKSAWAVAYATAQGTPDVVAVGNATLDPKCTGAGTSIICPLPSGKTLTIKTTLMSSPAGWACDPVTDCNEKP